MTCIFPPQLPNPFGMGRFYANTLANQTTLNRPAPPPPPPPPAPPIELDAESVLRQYLRFAGEVKPAPSVRLNSEGRVVVTIDSHDFVVVENKLIRWHAKPPPQVLSAGGIDSFRGMGA